MTSFQRVALTHYAIFGKIRGGNGKSAQGARLRWKDWSTGAKPNLKANLAPPDAVIATAGRYHVEHRMMNRGAFIGHPLGDSFAVSLLYPRDMPTQGSIHQADPDIARRAEHCEQVTLLFDRSDWCRDADNLIVAAIEWLDAARERLRQQDCLDGQPVRFVMGNGSRESRDQDKNWEGITQAVDRGESALVGREAWSGSDVATVASLLANLSTERRDKIHFSSGFSRHDPYFDLQLFHDRSLAAYRPQAMGYRSLAETGQVRIVPSDANADSIGLFDQPLDNEPFVDVAGKFDLLRTMAGKNRHMQDQIETAFIQRFQYYVQNKTLLASDDWARFAEMLHVPQILSKLFLTKNRSNVSNILECNLKLLEATGTLSEHTLATLFQQLTPLQAWQSFRLPESLNTITTSIATLQTLSDFAKGKHPLGIDQFSDVPAVTIPSGPSGPAHDGFSGNEDLQTQTMSGRS